MIYRILHFYCRFIIRLYIKRINITGQHHVPASGSVLLASTHPNSFLDAIIINLMLDRPVWSLARGDVFKKKWAAWMVTQVKMFPIYRISEGRENLVKNDETFLQVQKLLNKEEQVLIFAEGLCANQTKLLPLKKGLPRMLLTGWANDLPVPVIPIGLTYNDFDGFEKHVNLNFGEAITPTDFDEVEANNVFLRKFNELLTERLKPLLSWDFDLSKKADKSYYYLGWAINFPWYLLIQFIAKKLTKGTVHYDSVTFGMLSFTLPIYWGVLIAIFRSIF